MYPYEQPRSKCIECRTWCLNQPQILLSATSLPPPEHAATKFMKLKAVTLQGQRLCCSSTPETQSQAFNGNIFPGEHRILFFCRVANKKGISKVGGTWSSLWSVLGKVRDGGKGAATWRERSNSGRGEGGGSQLRLTSFFLLKRRSHRHSTHIWWGITIYWLSDCSFLSLSGCFV